MKLKFWLSVVTFLIGVFQAAFQCPTAENSIIGMFLRGHTFKTIKGGWPAGCYLMCEEEITCQSYNFVLGHKVCELNNRTKEARPEDFRPDQTRFYMKRAKKRGTHPLSLLACLFVFFFSNAAILNAGFRGEWILLLEQRNHQEKRMFEWLGCDGRRKESRLYVKHKTNRTLFKSCI